MYYNGIRRVFHNAAQTVITLIYFGNNIQSVRLRTMRL